MQVIPCMFLSLCLLVSSRSDAFRGCDSRWDVVACMVEMLKQAMARVDARARASYAIALTRALSRLLFLEALFL